MINITDLIKHRLEELGHEQRDLAAAAGVTESYISQLLTGKKALPAPNRSDIYKKIDAFLKLPSGELAKLANLQRREELKRTIEEPARPLFQEIRELILQKCKAEKAKQLHPIFEKEPFGEIERLITQKLLDVAKGVAKEEWNNENWLRVIARLNHKSYEEMRVIVLEFLDTDIFNLSVQNFLYFLDPFIQFWDIDLVSFRMKIVLVPELGHERIKQFEFVERESEPEADEQPGLRDFLKDASLSRDTTLEELTFLKQLRFRFKGKRPTALYYYRELQNLRDPLHFQVEGSG
jgi:transcriptional regulator with XRE-family HTH domain